MRDLAKVIHAYPTQAAAVRMAAIAYTRAHPPLSLRVVQRLRVIQRAIRSRWSRARGRSAIA
jgi:hypothetical protein